MNLAKNLRQWMTVSVTDPDERQRTRLLGILTVGLGGIAFLAMLLVAGLVLARVNGWEVLLPTLWSGLVFVAGMFAVLWLRRRGKVRSAAWLLLLLLPLMITLANIKAVAVGSTLFYFVIPVIAASFLVSPLASFGIAAMITVLFAVVMVVEHAQISFLLSGFPLFAIALVSWLAARNLGNALQELRTVNQELDQRVLHRTQELGNANRQLESQARELAKINIRLEEQTHDLEIVNTQLERQAQELLAANEKLKSLDRLKSKFVSDVTHELRTPISNLTIYMEMLRLGRAEKQERYINVLQEEITRLAQLVEDVLDLTRMELGTKKVEIKQVDLNVVAEQVVSANRLRAESKGLEMIFEPGVGLPLVLADASQMKQVVTNLVGNAVNYTQQGHVKIHLAYQLERRAVALSVEDTGMGIGPEDTPHLFERFYRGIQASQSSIPGTGLGLAITKEILDAHQGRIEVESELGKGSKFTVLLPVGEGSVPGQATNLKTVIS
jgi:signal transduction histidine kinase